MFLQMSHEVFGTFCGAGESNRSQPELKGVDNSLGLSVVSY